MTESDWPRAGVCLAALFLLLISFSCGEPTETGKPTPSTNGAASQGAETNTDPDSRTGSGEAATPATRGLPRRLPRRHDVYGLLPATVGEWPVTQGAAAGYVPDQSCRACHEDLFESYQDMGMARSFYRPDPSKPVETFGETFHHEASDSYYEMRVRDGKYVLKRYCKDSSGGRFAEHEAEVAWIVGSGNHVRTYLAQDERGTLYELPISWYAEKGWEMSPGYGHANHARFERTIDSRCMFCHNAYPEVPVGSDRVEVPVTLFPKELPHGIGCQRCHGPGARHIEMALDENATDEAIRSRILDPADFSPKQKKDLCNTCHLQPESSGDTVVRRIEHSIYAHRPDKDLGDYIVHLDFGDEAERREKIEVNHHGYRMQWSKCFTASEGKMTCLSCHDPHKKVKKADQAAHYRKKCFGCHEVDACAMKSMGGEESDSAKSDCVGCHMVRARPRDAVHVTITDHFIRRHPPEKDLAAPIPPRSPAPRDRPVVPNFPGRIPEAPHYGIYVGQTAMNYPTRKAMVAWRKALAEVAPDQPGPYVQIASAMMRVADHAGVIEVVRPALKRFPKSHLLHWLLADALNGSGKPREGLAAIDNALALDADDPLVLNTHGKILATLGRLAEARAAIEKALAAYPSRHETWRDLGKVLFDLRLNEEACKAFEKLTALNPNDPLGYLLRAESHRLQGQIAAQFRTLRQGATRSTAVALELIRANVEERQGFGDLAAAKVIAMNLVKASPKDSIAQLHLALVSIAEGKAAPAATAIRAARNAGGPPGLCAGVEAIRLRASGDRAAAARQVERFKQDRPQPGRDQLSDFIARQLGL